jgi:hypothetical protein
MAKQGKRHRFGAGMNLTLGLRGWAFVFKRLAQVRRLLQTWRDYQSSFQSAKPFSTCQQQHGCRER